jgi:hypothetical protein
LSGVLMVGWDQLVYVTALSIGGIVCIAASNGGTTSQDLKTGFLVGATPRHQQVAILVGALASALILGPILLEMNKAGTVYVPVASDPTLSFPAGFKVDPAELHKDGDQPKTEQVQGRKAPPTPTLITSGSRATAKAERDQVSGQQRRHSVYLADPAINWHISNQTGWIHSQNTTHPSGAGVLIIKGILSHKLPWGLVLLGVMIA